MKRLSLQVGFFVLLGCLLYVAEAQYSGSSAGNSPGGVAGGDLSGTYPNPGVAKLNGVAASNYVQSGSAPWLFAPTSASGTAYVGTPSLLDGTAIPVSLLAAPVNGQQMVFFPDVPNISVFTITIDGSTARSARNLNSLSFGANDIIPGIPYLFSYRTSSNRWIAHAGVSSFTLAGGSGLTNSGTPFTPIIKITSPDLRGVTGSISGNLTLGTCDTGTATVTGATTAMVAVASPTTNPGTGVIWNAYVSAADTVTVSECGLAIVTPTATTYQVAVIQ